MAKPPVNPDLWTPPQVCQFIKRKFPKIWRTVDETVAKGKATGRWPPWCYLSLDAAREIIHSYPPLRFTEVPPLFRRSDPVERVSILRETWAQRLCMHAAWRAGKGVYGFDEDFYDEVAYRTRTDGHHPSEVIKHMPEWAMWIETKPYELGGFQRDWILITLTVDGGAPMLLIDADIFMPFVMPIGDWSIDAALRLRFKDDPEDDSSEAQRGFKKLLENVLPIILYVCTENADFGSDGRRPRRPEPVRTKKGLRYIIPSEIPRWTIGEREGVRLRLDRARAREREAEREASDGEREPDGDQDSEGRTRKRPKAHARKAHKHGFWCGPRDQPGARKLVYKWIQEISVNAEGPDDLITTHYDVEIDPGDDDPSS